MRVDVAVATTGTLNGARPLQLVPVETIDALVQQLQRSTVFAIEPCHDDDAVVLSVAELGLCVQQHAAAQHAAVDAGVVAVLTSLLTARAAPFRVHRVALATTLLLLHDNAAIQATAAAAGVIRCVVALLTTATSSVRILALRVLRLLVHGHEAHQLDNGVDTLVLLVRDGHGIERVEAVRVIASLCDGNDVARALVAEKADAIGAVLPSDASHADQRDPLWPTSAIACSVLQQYLLDYHRRRDNEPVDALNALVTRLRTAVDDERHDDEPWRALLALEELNDVVERHEQLATTVPAVGTDVVSLCIDRLCTGTPTERNAAGQLLATLAFANSEVHHTVMDRVGIDALVEMLADDGTRAGTRVLCSLLDRAQHSSARLEAVASGAIPALVLVLRDGRWDERLLAAGALGWLVRNNDTAQTEALHAGALPLLMQLVPHAHASLQPHVVATLRYVVERNASAQDALELAGGVPLLVQLLASGTTGTRAASAQTIAVLVANHVCLQTAFTDAGALAALVLLFLDDDDNERTRLLAGWALCYLAGGHTANVATLVAGPVLPRLVVLLDVGVRTAERIFAATMLHVLAMGDAAAQAAIAGAGAIVALVRMLERSDASDTERRTAAMSLGTLVDGNVCNQVAAIAAGALAPLTAMLHSDADADGSAAAEPLEHLIRGITCSAIDTRVLRALADILCIGDDQLQYEVLTVLMPLVTDDATVRLLRAVIPLSALLDILQSPVAALQMMAAVVVVGVTENEPASRVRAIEAGVVRVLVELIGSEADFLPRSALLSVVACLVGDSDAATCAAVDAGAVALTRFLLETADDNDVKQNAAAAFASLAPVQDDAVGVGVLTPLRALVHSGNVNDRLLAAMALAALVRDHAANQEAVVNACDVVPALVAMLCVPTESTTVDSGEDRQYVAEAQREAARALANLTDRNPVAQAAVAHAGAVPLLHALVHATRESTKPCHDKTKAAATRALQNLNELDAVLGPLTP